VREYLIDLNATAAYKRAGYKGKGRAAQNAASRMLGFVGVDAAIQEAMKERANRLQITADEAGFMFAAHNGFPSGMTQRLCRKKAQRKHKEI
jgi:phage terminase small subunit